MIKKVLITILGFFAVGALIGFAFSWAGSRDLVGPGEKLETEAGKVMVPENRIPDDFAGLLAAPAITLLPNHTASDPVRSDITRDDVEALLAVWENMTDRKNYEKRVEKIVPSQSNGTVLRRSDSVDLPGACALAQCAGHFEWVRGSFGNMKVETVEGSHAHVTGQGAVTYRGDREFNPRAGVSYVRYYGLLLKKEDGKWLLERAAAETGAPLN